ncbi:response regulator [Paramicrobacterium agarici]|uniref:LuxR family two component transcriptional regulator n=1 Tax=Paramicrobacterium agarici TaxID=630514 RepID=A0A2A9DZQ4_9MICO|nr:response regulator transcription factor [Microbacterium agarici]PFG31400.1 LuxR family two component transcriptional regulator [Microbacterium agarici]
MTIRILLVDDQDLMRLGLAMVLGDVPDFSVVGEAADGESGVARAGELNPDVVLMDVRMPGVDGIEATRRIVADHPETRVIVLTTFDLDEYAFSGLNAGASGFLVKDAPADQLIAAVRAVHAGDAAVSPRVTKRMLELYGGSLPEQGATASDELASLSERERDVLVLVGEGLTNTEIAARLYLAESTVKTHVGRLLAKLELRDRIGAVILAHRSGLV